MNTDPIVLIDDDIDDLDTYKQALSDLKVDNKVFCFSNGLAFLEFMRKTDISFSFILCDINMTPINGLQLKKILHDDSSLRLKTIPFLFLSTSNAAATIAEAYSLDARAYFVKPSTYEEVKELFASIISYWNFSRHPVTRDIVHNQQQRQDYRQ